MRITDEMDSPEYASFHSEKNGPMNNLTKPSRGEGRRKTKEFYEDVEKENNLLSAGFFP